MPVLQVDILSVRYLKICDVSSCSKDQNHRFVYVFWTVCGYSYNSKASGAKMRVFILYNKIYWLDAGNSNGEERMKGYATLSKDCQQPCEEV